MGKRDYVGKNKQDGEDKVNFREVVRAFDSVVINQNPRECRSYCWNERVVLGVLKPVPTSREIWNTKDSVVVQTGSGGSFHEFCTSVCLSLYEAQQQRPIPQSGDPADATRCSICQKTGEVRPLTTGQLTEPVAASNLLLCFWSCRGRALGGKGFGWKR